MDAILVQFKIQYEPRDRCWDLEMILVLPNGSCEITCYRRYTKDDITAVQRRLEEHFASNADYRLVQ